MMKLPVAATLFGLLAVICTVAYGADSGDAFLWLALVNLIIAGFLLGLWLVDMFQIYRHPPRHPPVDPDDNERIDQ